MNQLDTVLKELRSLKREVIQLREMINPETQDEFLNFRQACKTLGVSNTKCYQMLRNGELPFATKMGKTWRFSKNGLIKYLSRS